MSLNYQIGMRLDEAAFGTDVGKTLGTLKTLDTGLAHTQTVATKLELPRVAAPAGAGAAPGAQATAAAGATPAAGGAGDTSGAAADVSALGGQMRAALAAGLGPLQAIGPTITAQLNVIGGTVVTLARRIDNSMKLPLMENALTSLRTKIRSGVGAASTAAVESLTKVQKATLAMGPAADKAITAYLGFSKIKGIFQSMGDVAGKSLAKLKGIKLDDQVAGANKLRGGIAAIGPAAQTAATGIKNIGVQIGIAFGVGAIIFKAATAVKDFFVGGIMGAVNLQETMSKTTEVFGEQTGHITSQADDLAQAFGLPKQAILDANSAIGLLGQGAGQSQSQAASMSTAMVQLASDAMSFYNVPFDVALDKIRSGLAGESEPLRAFGVMLSEDAVKAQALSMGLIKGKEDMNDQAKVAARAALITKGLGKASGDLARTGGGTANQMRSLSGTITNMATELGQTLMPAVDAGIATLAQFAKAGVASFESFKPALAGFAAGVSETFSTVGVMFRNYDSVLEISRLTAVGWGQNFIAILATIPENVSLIADYLRKNWYQLLVDLVNSTKTMSENIDKNLVGLFKSIQGFFAGEGFNFQWTPLLDGFKATADQLPELIKPALVSMDDQIAAVGQNMADLEATRAQVPEDKAPVAPGGTDDLGGGAKKAKGDKYEGAAAVTLGSTEAASSIAKFRNQGAPDQAPIKETAKATAETAIHTKDMATALKELAARSGRASDAQLSTYSL